MKASADATVTLMAVDDDPSILRMIQEALDQDDLEILTASNTALACELIRQIKPDIVLLDLHMPGASGMSLLEDTLLWNPAADVAFLTGDYSTDFAVEAIQKGACDYLTKPVEIPVLRERIGRLVTAARARRQAARLEQELLEASRFEGMVGRSPEMLDVFARVRRIAPHFRSVLVTGATGTGKEPVARTLHQLCPASAKPLVVCNCAAVVDTLFETELFGHVRGAFTGAQQDRIGLYEAAAGGCLFLDEVGEIPLSAQSKLLRALQNHEVQRVGSAAIRHVDVRVIAATNRDLRAMIQKGLFREDLYYRLSMVEIKLPTLAQRKEDLPLLERHFVDAFSQLYRKKIRGLTHRAQRLLSAYHWPGNVRELENAIGAACMMTESEMIDTADLPEYLRTKTPTASRDGELLSLEEVERRHVRYVLSQVNDNKARAAEILGISRATIYRLLNEDGAAKPAEAF